MAAFPEYGGKGASGPSSNTLSRILSIFALITGILLSLSFILVGLTAILWEATVLKEYGDYLEGAAHAGPIAGIIGGILGFIIAVFVLLTAISAKKGRPYRWVKIAALIWSIFLIIMSITTTIFAAAGADKIGSDASTALNVVALVGAILLLIGAILTRPGASFGMFLAGGSLLLVGVILLLVGSVMGGGLNDSAYVIGNKGTESSQFLALASLTGTFILIGMMIGVVGLLMAPFLGKKNLWVVELLAAIGVLVASAGSIYYSARIISDYLDLARSEFIEGIAKAAAVSGVVSSVLMTISLILLLIVSILAIIKILMGLTTKPQPETGPAPPTGAQLS